MNNKVLLMILDGWGNGRHDKADVISTVHPEYISAMTAKYPHAELPIWPSGRPTFSPSVRSWAWGYFSVMAEIYSGCTVEITSALS